MPSRVLVKSSVVRRDTVVVPELRCRCWREVIARSPRLHLRRARGVPAAGLPGGSRVLMAARGPALPRGKPPSSMMAWNLRTAKLS